MNPEATFDSLLIAERLQAQWGRFSFAEIHLFSYLACLLWMYEERPAADWGYMFAGTELGSPFSVDIAAASLVLTDNGFFAKYGDEVLISESGLKSLEEFATLQLNAERISCLRAACSAAIAFSPGIVAAALGEEPDLKRSHELPSNRSLLETGEVEALYDQFDAVREAVGEQVVDLRLPATVWLEALYRTALTNEA